MAENSNIAWTDHTHNHWIGCTKVSPGCDHCYAEAWNKRFDGGANWGAGAPRRLTSQQNRNKPLRWQREAVATGTRPRVFCSSLADVFDNEVPDDWRADLFDLIERTPNLDWILVTKRVGNVRKLAPVGGFGPNVIVLATIVDQAEADRDLGKLVALKRGGVAHWVGVSYEPALGFVDWSRWLPRQGGPIYDAAGGIMDVVDEETGIDWLIVGGESAQGGAVGRMFDTAWARIAVAQCSAAGTPVFVKQLGARCAMPRRDAAWPVTKGAVWNLVRDQQVVAHGVATFRDGAGADPAEWPEDLRVRQFPVIGGAA